MSAGRRVVRTRLRGRMIGLVALAHDIEYRLSAESVPKAYPPSFMIVPLSFSLPVAEFRHLWLKWAGIARVRLSHHRMSRSLILPGVQEIRSSRSEV